MKSILLWFLVVGVKSSFSFLPVISILPVSNAPRGHHHHLHPSTTTLNTNNHKEGLQPRQIMAKKTKKKRNRNNNKTSSNHDEAISIVGPDCIEVLKGQLLEKNVALVLCGESHEDAIDVTRKGGRFDGKEGWIPLARDEILFEFNNYNSTSTSNDKDAAKALEDVLMVRILAVTKRPQPLGKAKDWATRVIEDDNDDSEVLPRPTVLLWVEEEETANARVSKGNAFLLTFASKESLPDDDDDDYDSDVEGEDENWLSFSNSDFPCSVRRWFLEDGSQQWNNNNQRYESFEWGDFDLEAFQLNRRRLTEEEIDTSVLDGIIENRKQRLRTNEHIWTWDDWFAHVRNKNTNRQDGTTAATTGTTTIELVLEASVPPWELSLFRPSINDFPEKTHLPSAAECIRCVSEDEEGDIEDLFDPSSDGIGSYLDFVYRRFMEEMIRGSVTDETASGVPEKSTWLHCVDIRDIGCEAACHSQSVKGMWNSLLLSSEEAAALVGAKASSEKMPPFLRLEPDASNCSIKFVPENRMNPERVELEQLRSEGNLVVPDDDEEEKETVVEDEEDDGFTFPSFEGFFGQNTDFLYYSPHVKMSYAPFLAKCVKSLPNWEIFFSNLFFGGTIPDALENLDLDGNKKEYLYVRSAILKAWNEETSSFEYHERDDGEHYISYPFFPFIFHLFAKGSNPPQTLSSHLFASLCRQGIEQERVASIAREWTMEKINQCSQDPKGSDDPHCGGEWFEAFLRAAHRDIYDDIDLSDSTVLLQKNKMKSLTSGRKHNIGKIKIPSCKNGFDEIVHAFNSTAEPVVTPRTEVMAKILIDIWMSNLLDFTTVLKIAEIVSRSSTNDVVIVAYMGTAHTRALADFFLNRMGFKKKTFLGKVDWDEDEPRNIVLPKYLWNITELF